MKDNHYSDVKSLNIKFHREDKKRFAFSQLVPTIDEVLEDMGLDRDEVGTDSLEWFENWLIKNKENKFEKVPCLERIAYGDWTISFICDM